MPLSPQTLLALEKRTLTKIATLKPFEVFDNLRLEAQKCRHHLDPNRGCMDFHAILSLKVLEMKPNRKVEILRRFDVAGLIEVSSNRKEVIRSSYQLVIGRGPTHLKPILRKVHFDFEPVADSRDRKDEPKPTVHMQIGGKLLPQWAEGKGYAANQYHHHYPWFEKPRIPCFPICLALLLDWVFMEFSDSQHVEAVLKDSEWNAHVREAESIVIAPFVGECHNFLNRRETKKLRLLRHHLYGQPA